MGFILRYRARSRKWDEVGVAVGHKFRNRRGSDFRDGLLSSAFPGRFFYPLCLGNAAGAAEGFTEGASFGRRDIKDKKTFDAVVGDALGEVF